MTFEYRDDATCDKLVAQPDTDDDRKPVVFLSTTGLNNGVYVPVDRVEEVVAGIRDAARTAAAIDTASDTAQHPAARQTTGQDDTDPDPTTADDPTPLRWGLGDVEHGDDDTVTVYLSGPDREPYWLELEPERAAALRDDLAAPAVGQPAEAHDTEQLVPVGWWCWRGNDHGHLAHTACRSDNVPFHVPAEWASEMRAVIRHLTDDHDPGEDCTWVTPEEQAAETRAAADVVEDER